MIPNEPLARYEQLRVAYAPGMPGTFSPQPRVSDLDMHHGTCVTLSSGFLWSRCWVNRSRHSRRMRNPQFCISGKRTIEGIWHICWYYGLIYWVIYRCIILRSLPTISPNGDQVIKSLFFLFKEPCIAPIFPYKIKARGVQSNRLHRDNTIGNYAAKQYICYFELM